MKYISNVIYYILLLLEAPINLFLSMCNSGKYISWSLTYLEGKEYKRIMKEFEVKTLQRKALFQRAEDKFNEAKKSLNA